LTSRPKIFIDAVISDQQKTLFDFVPQYKDQTRIFFQPSLREIFEFDTEIENTNMKSSYLTTLIPLIVGFPIEEQNPSKRHGKLSKEVTNNKLLQFPYSKHQAYMEMAFDAATSNMLRGQGGPFGAVIVKDGEVISVGWNKVTSANDPTAHAEVTRVVKSASGTGSASASASAFQCQCRGRSKFWHWNGTGFGRNQAF